MFLHFLNEWANNFFAGLGVELHVESYALSLDGSNEFHGVTPSQGLGSGRLFDGRFHFVAQNPAAALWAVVGGFSNEAADVAHIGAVRALHFVVVHAFSFGVWSSRGVGMALVIRALNSFSRRVWIAAHHFACFWV
jgi:hypothetical protein